MFSASINTKELYLSSQILSYVVDDYAEDIFGDKLTPQELLFMLEDKYGLPLVYEYV